MNDREARALEATRTVIVRALRAREVEIQERIVTHLRTTVPDSVGDGSPEYALGLSAAVAAALDYSLTVLERGEAWPGAVPVAVIEQAGRAVRNGVGLETVMRRVAAGERLLKTFAADEVDHLPARTLDRVLSALEVAAERLMEALADAYNRERGQVASSSTAIRLATVRRLLADEPVESRELTELDYELHGAWHVGLIAVGTGAESALGCLKTAHGCSLLAVSSGSGDIWAWLGGGSELDAADIEVHGPGVSLAVGSARRGIEGWRQTHREADGASLLLSRGRERLVRYGCRALLVAALQDETLAGWLEAFLLPLRSRADGEGILEALRAYIDAECNYRAAGSALDHDRHTVASRVRKAEQLLGRPVRTCLPELDVALRLHELKIGAHTRRSADEDVTRIAQRSRRSWHDLSSGSSASRVTNSSRSLF